MGRESSLASRMRARVAAGSSSPPLKPVLSFPARGRSTGIVLIGFVNSLGGATLTSAAPSSSGP